MFSSLHSGFCSRPLRSLSGSGKGVLFTSMGFYGLKLVTLDRPVSDGYWLVTMEKTVIASSEYAGTGDASLYG
ncbi:hypothetical protein MO408_27395 (plasmid) [Klebsiella pneumoniae]|nr:hypothetical protein MO408_27395 [Klebsiella pneumoniae]